MGWGHHRVPQRLSEVVTGGRELCGQDVGKAPEGSGIGWEGKRRDLPRGREPDVGSPRAGRTGCMRGDP